MHLFTNTKRIHVLQTFEMYVLIKNDLLFIGIFFYHCCLTNTIRLDPIMGCTMFPKTCLHKYLQLIALTFITPV